MNCPVPWMCTKTFTRHHKISGRFKTGMLFCFVLTYYLPKLKIFIIAFATIIRNQNN